MTEPSELDRQREIVFSAEPPGQAERASRFLSGLPGCKVEPGDNTNALRISYNLRDHTLDELENRLAEEGLHLDRGLLHSIGRQVIHYCEDTVRHNLGIPAYPTKQNEREVFVRAYDQEPHGDRDDVLPELRDYK
ncbi:hypothetical protein [Candidatus Ferrigenium straubiae]|jgi:hypothetical protein|uniref:hypothetical protein n=1 Tax=Candidatus Ferrigenium straubiae TaxID=2919506 RepID=UPI003F4AD05C